MVMFEELGKKCLEQMVLDHLIREAILNGQRVEYYRGGVWHLWENELVEYGLSWRLSRVGQWFYSREYGFVQCAKHDEDGVELSVYVSESIFVKEFNQVLLFPVGVAQWENAL